MNIVICRFSVYNFIRVEYSSIRVSSVVVLAKDRTLILQFTIICLYVLRKVLKECMVFICKDMTILFDEAFCVLLYLFFLLDIIKCTSLI